MPRKVEVVVLLEHTANGKIVIVKERSIGQIEDLINKVMGTNVSDIIKADDPDQLKSSIMGVLTDNIPDLFPPLTADDVKKLYPSEVEELVEAFITVNFFGLKRLAAPLMGIIRQQQAK